jgi:hypothetical protein
LRQFSGSSFFIAAGPSLAKPSGMNNQVIALPQSRTLAGFVSEPGCDEGLAIESLAPGTMLIVQTDNSEYRMIVLDGDGRRVLVEGGVMFPEPVSAVVQGASSGGSLVKTGWIGVGLRMELFVDPRWTITSPVRSIALVSSQQ